MKQLQLPKEITSHIFDYIEDYIIDCFSIPASLSEDIRHVAECKRIIAEASSCYFKYNNHMWIALEDLIGSYLYCNLLFEKYNRQMIWVCDTPIKNTIITVKKINGLQNYMEYVMHKELKRIGKYYGNNRFTHKEYLEDRYARTGKKKHDYYTAQNDRSNKEEDILYRVVHNILCQLETEDRKNAIKHYSRDIYKLMR